MKPVLFIVFLWAGTSMRAQGLDEKMIRSINTHSSAFKNGYANFSGGAVTPLAIGIPVGLCLAGIIKKDEKFTTNSLYMGGSYLVSAITVYSVKRIVARKRPYQEYSYIILRASPDDNRSFPSGHTSAAFATATAVSLRYRKWYYVVPAYLFAASAGWARMYQGVHYPSDVLAGALVGSGAAWLGYYLQKKMASKRPPPNPKF